MQVTTEDGGRLNAFAKEPRMEVIDAGSSRGTGTQLMLISGAVLVVALMAVTVVIS
ncbi:MAG: photosystem II assembly protein Psb34 [Synechococcus sp.]